MPGLCPMCGTQLAEGSRFCHKCGLPLSSETPPSPPPSRPVRLVRGLMLLSWLTCAAGTLAIPTIGLESIVLSGPFLAGLAFLTLLASLATRNHRASVVGLTHVGFCLVIFLLFFALAALRSRMSTMYTTVSLMGILYTLATVPLTVWAWLVRPDRRNPWVCVRCGYVLRGLTEARCPECGTAFDPKLLATANRTDQG